MNDLKTSFVAYCKKHKYEYECGYDWCDCTDFGDFVNVRVNGKWHTLYCMNDGTYKFGMTVVKTVTEIDRLLQEEAKA